MKRIKLYLFLLMIGIFANSCDKGFEEINISPVKPTSLDPAFLLTDAQRASGRSTLLFETPFVQQALTPFGSRLTGGNYNVWYEQGSGGVLGEIFGGPLKELIDILNKTKDNPERSNLYNMARIWKAYNFQVAVDTYGDVPYTEAGKGFLEGITLPEYEDQEVIYDDLLKELTEATAALDASKTTEKNDLFYRGDIAKWKKLGNSLLLRVAMRLSEVNPTKAQQYVTIATNPSNGGLMSSNADNAMVNSSNEYQNPNAVNFQGTERANFYLGEPFLNYLKTTNDPRLSRIAVLYQFPAQDLAKTGTANTNPADQIGMPFGYNDLTIATAPNYPGKSGAAWKYSQVNRRTLAKIDAPQFFVTYSQTQLLLAEAAVRGWYAGDAAALYNAGVKGHMDEIGLYDATAIIPIGEQNSYLAENPFNAADANNQIGSQYWISSFLNGPEAWSNFRRSGFPALLPNPYPGADISVKGDFARRLPYPARELSVNKANVDEAIARQGPDNMGTRVFWDN